MSVSMCRERNPHQPTLLTFLTLLENRVTFPSLQNIKIRKRLLTPENFAYYFSPLVFFSSLIPFLFLNPSCHSSPQSSPFALSVFLILTPQHTYMKRFKKSFSLCIPKYQLSLPIPEPLPIPIPLNVSM